MKNKLKIILTTILLTVGMTTIAQAKVVKTISAGTDYIHTSVVLSGDWNSSEGVVIGTVQNFVDNLCGADFAIQNNFPIFYSQKDSLSQEVLDRIKALGATKVYLLGGQGVLSSSLETQIKNINSNIQITRYFGQTRFETSNSIADAMHEINENTTAFLANAYNYPDALSATSEAGENGIPILLTNVDSIPDTTINELKKLNIKNVKIYGGLSVVSQNVETQLKSMNISVERIGGQNRYQTSLLALKSYLVKSSEQGLTLVSGQDWHNALIASPYGLYEKGNSILLYDNGVENNIKDYVKDYDLIVVGDITDFNTTATAPSMSKTPDNMANLQSLVSSLPKSNIVSNDASGILYSNGNSSMNAQYTLNNSYQMVYHNNTDSNELSLTKTFLGETMEDADVTEIYNSLTNATSIVFDLTNTSDIDQSWHNTADGKYAYQVNNPSGTEVDLYYKQN